MTRSRYNIRESLNRILRAMEGSPLTSDTPEVIPGEILSHDEALADIAELVEGSLPSQTGQLPAGISVPAANLTFATSAEVRAGTSTTKIVNPNVYNDAQYYGGIYVNTGTCTMESLPSTGFTKISGSFQNSMSYEGAVPAPTSDKLTITDYGFYHAWWNASIIGSSDVVYEIEVYSNAVGLAQTSQKAKPSASGTVVNLSGNGIFYLSGTAIDVDLRVRPGTNSVWMRLDSGQLVVRRIANTA